MGPDPSDSGSILIASANFPDRLREADVAWKGCSCHLSSRNRLVSKPPLPAIWSG